MRVGEAHGPAGTDPRGLRASVVVIGAGQAGMSAGFHLQRRGFASALAAGPSEARADEPRSFVMLDAEDGPGGAWRHRWASLTMATVNGIFELPRFAKPSIDPAEASRVAVPAYFASFEERMGLPVLRPVTVTAVRRADEAPDRDLLVESSAGMWRTRAIVNATGTWNSPVIPDVPGRRAFRGRQLHTRDYVSLDEFIGLRVAIVGGGISAVQHLEEISRVAETFWYTRREPVFHEGPFMPETDGRATIAKVTADVEAGRPTGSIVSYTGLTWLPAAVAARDRGVLVRRPMFTAIEPDGVREADGTLTRVDVILWATGFRPSLRHLDPLGLRNAAGGIRLAGTRVADEPRVHLVGFGSTQSTVGANRAGRAVARELDALLRR